MDGLSNLLKIDTNNVITLAHGGADQVHTWFHMAFELKDTIQTVLDVLIWGM